MSRSQYAQVPQETAEEEMYAAFDNGDDDDNLDDDGHHPSQPLLSSHRQDSSWHPLDSSTDNLHRNTDSTVLFDASNPTNPPTHTSNRSVGGTYDFEYDYASMPPPGSPPELHLAQPNAYGNSNGLVPSSPPLIVSGARPPNFLSRALGAILPTHYAHDRRGGGLGNDGVFGNVVAKPAGAHPAGSNGEDGHQTGPYEVPEFAQKDAPPSYNSAQADAVPPYWENTILAPSGPLDGDMIIEGLPVGSVFAFLWNLLVSVSFQFVGFLLTYLLHTSHASKYGSRAGLGVTLIQYGFYMRSAEAQAQLSADGDNFWGWPEPPLDPAAAAGQPDASVVATTAASAARSIARRALPLLSRVIEVYSNGTSSTPGRINNGPGIGPFTTSAPVPSDEIANPGGSPNPDAIGPADWFSFMIMTIGWFLLITSFLGYWRVKRWERGVLRSVQSTAAQVPSSTEREPTPTDLARNAQVLRNLEAAFGIQWETEVESAADGSPSAPVGGIGRPRPLHTPSSVVSPHVQPGPATSGAGPRGDGGLFGLAAALNAQTAQNAARTLGSSTPAPATSDANGAGAGGAETEEHATRRGTRRLFRVRF